VSLSARALRVKEALPLALMATLPVKEEEKSEESTSPLME
jgi:hypothetical protein